MSLGGWSVPRLRRLVLERLMRYYRWLADSGIDMQTVTSAQISEALDVDPTQVRKDLGAIGLLGIGRVGFDVCEICRAVRVALGFDQEYEAVVIGTGHLGGALMAYGGFEPYGLRVVAAFDNDPRKVGTTVAGQTVRPMKGMTSFIKRRRIRLAILTTPAGESQKLADRLVAAGVEAIWNFSPSHLAVRPGVVVRNEHISRGLSQIAYHLKQ